ncbi:MAG: L,D-transpeptidase family protein [Bacteroidota bacterium]
MSYRISFITLFVIVGTALAWMLIKPGAFSFFSKNHSNADTTITIKTYLDSNLCDGFDFPVGDKNGNGKYVSKKDGKTYDSWYVASGLAETYSLGIHTGEDWNGRGGGNTDEGQPVYSIANGIVLTAENYGSPWGKVVYVMHRFLENGKIDTVFSLYAHLDEMFVKTGDTVKRRKNIGTIGTGDGAYIAHLHLEIRKNSMKNFDVTYWPSSYDKDAAWVKDQYLAPTAFIKERRGLTFPHTANKLIIAFKHNYKMYWILNGKVDKEYEIALSQNPIGHKQKQGDNKLPEGEYHIVQKTRGPFGGEYAAYYGPGWMRISYPNRYDANAAFEKKKISKAERDAIVVADKACTEPLRNTALGGGIGVHGWAGDWTADGTQNLTWGCISMHNEDLDKFYDLVPVGTTIIIVP